MTIPTETVFVDSSGWIALLNSRDSLHSRAKELYRDKLRGGSRLLTTTAVLLEVGNWLSPSPLRQLATDLLDRIERSNLVSVVFVDNDLYTRGWAIYRERPDKDWGITDCISFAVMAEQRILEAFSADHHFEQAGFVRLLF